MDVPTTTREIHLAARPHGEPVPTDFETVEVDLPDPGPGQVLVRNLAMSVDPYMRGRMNDAPSYAPPWQLGEAAQGGAVGEVVAVGSADGDGSGTGGSGVTVGDLVVHGAGWREHALLPVEQVRVVTTSADVPLTYHLGVLGMVGLTAYAGLFEVAGLQSGDRVFVSGAAGAVGGLVVQFARLRGAGRVIGSAGSAAKVAFLRDELGADAAFDYHDGPVRDLLADAAPDGIDVFFDNVGGDHLEAALDAFVVHGRGALCGSISGYNATGRHQGPDNMSLMIGKRLRLQGFLVGDHAGVRPQFERDVTAWLGAGDLVVRETVTDGLDHAVDAFIGMLRGENTGKAVVRLGEPA